MAFWEGGSFDPEAELDVDEEEEAFEAGFVELGGVAGGDEVYGEALRGGGREDDGPGFVGDFAPEFSVDEVGDAAEEDAWGSDGGDEVAEAEEGGFGFV